MTTAFVFVVILPPFVTWRKMNQNPSVGNEWLVFELGRERGELAQDQAGSSHGDAPRINHRAKLRRTIEKKRDGGEG